MNRVTLIVVALFAVALPTVAQDAPSAAPILQLESPNCLSPTQAVPDLDAPPIVETIGGSTCHAFLPDGSPNPDWPECNSGTGPTIPSPSCSGYSTCYCFCRYNHRCDQDPAECTPLANCLNSCDAQYPGCPYPGGGYPSSPAECL